MPPSEEMGTDVPTHTTAMNMNSNMGVGGGVRPVKRLRCETTVRSDSQSTEDAMETNREPTRPRLAEGLEVGDSKREMEVAGVGTGKGKGSDEGGEEGGGGGGEGGGGGGGGRGNGSNDPHGGARTRT